MFESTFQQTDLRAIALFTFELFDAGVLNLKHYLHSLQQYCVCSIFSFLHVLMSSPLGAYQNHLAFNKPTGKKNCRLPKYMIHQFLPENDDVSSVKHSRAHF